MTFDVAQYFAQPRQLTWRPLAEVAERGAADALLQTQRDNTQVLAGLAGSALDSANTLYRENQSRKFTADQNRRVRQADILSRMAGSNLGLGAAQIQGLIFQRGLQDPMQYARYLQDNSANLNAGAYSLLGGAQRAVGNAAGIAVPNS